jgi:hypothetical protein
MTQHRVFATFEITVDIDFLIDDDEGVEGLDAPAPTDEQLMHLAEARADEIKEDLHVVSGGDNNFISEVTYDIHTIEAEG